MIIRRKLFTRQETKAIGEIYGALRNGNIGRGLSAKKFVKARHVSNETIDALTGWIRNDSELCKEFGGHQRYWPPRNCQGL